MCTLIAIFRRVQGAPLVIAANRDEYYERPAEALAVRPEFEGVGGPVIAPLDRRAGGTWLGVNAEGLFAGVTNLRNDILFEQRAPFEQQVQRRSRGMVVADALRQPSAVRAADMLKALPEEAYNPFNCFVSDGSRAFHLVYRDVPRIRELDPGVHVIGNLDPDEEQAPVAKLERVKEAARMASERPGFDGLLEGLGMVCREHDTGGGGVGDTCVHLDQYGTRSSTLVILADTQGASRLLFADGPPCEAKYEDFSTLLNEQSQRAGCGQGETAVRNAS